MFFISSNDFPAISSIIIIMITKIIKQKAIATGIQRGEVTHIQDQSILLVNFKIRKTINKTAVRLRPLFVVFMLLN